MDPPEDYLDDYTPQEVVDRYFGLHKMHDVIAKFVLEAVEAFFNKNITNETKPVFDHMVDVGCGSGRQTVEFQSYFSRITAVDISEGQIVMAKKVYSNISNINFATGSAENIPVDDASADVIISTFGTHFFDIEKFEKECLRILKPHGVAVLLGCRTIKIAPAAAFNIDQKLISDSAESWLTAFTSMAQYAVEVNHPQRNLYDRFQAMYDGIQYMKKSRDDSRKFVQQMPLSNLRKYYSAIPFNSFPKPKAILEDFWGKVKERVKDRDDDDIIMDRTNEVFILTLSM